MLHGRDFLKTILMKISPSNTTIEVVTLKRALSAPSTRVHSETLMMKARVNSLIPINMLSSSCHETKLDRFNRKLILEAVSSRILLWALTNKYQRPNTMEYFSISRVKGLVAQFPWTNNSHSNLCLFRISQIIQVTQLKICTEITWDRVATIHRWARKTSI